MALDLTGVVQAEMRVSRMELKDDIYPTLQYNHDANGWTNVLTLNTDNYHWDMRQVSNSAIHNPYIVLRILEDDANVVINAIKGSEAVIYDGMRYKLSREQPPFGVVRIHALRLDYLEEIT